MSDNKQIDSSSVISEKRRKLLKASVATPLVATLTLGSGQAAATSAFQCVSNNKDASADNFTTTTDSFVRVSARIYTTNNAGSSNGATNPIYEILPSQAPPVYLNEGGDEEEINLKFYNDPVEGYVLDVYQPLLDNSQPVQAKRLGPWPENKFADNDNQILYQSCWHSVPIVDVNKIKGNIV